MRTAKWEKFHDWYFGSEKHAKIPGRGRPTLARVLVAESIEAGWALKDEVIVSICQTEAKKILQERHEEWDARQQTRVAAVQV